MPSSQTHGSFPWPKLMDRSQSPLLPWFVVLMSSHPATPPHHSTWTRSYTHLLGNGNVSLIHGPLLPGLRTRLAGAPAAREEVRAAPSILMCTWTGLGVNPAPSHTCSWPHLKRSHQRTCTHGTQLYTVLPRGKRMEKHTIPGGYPHNPIQESHRVRRAGCKPIGSTAPVPWPVLLDDLLPCSRTVN